MISAPHIRYRPPCDTETKIYHYNQQDDYQYEHARTCLCVLLLLTSKQIKRACTGRGDMQASRLAPTRHTRTKQLGEETTAMSTLAGSEDGCFLRLR